MAELHTRPQTTEDIRIFGMLTVLVRERRLILATVAVFVIAALAILLLSPHSYAARTVVVQARSQQSSVTQALLSQLPAGLASLGSAQVDDDREVRAVLASQSLADSVIGRLKVDGSDEAEVRSILAHRTEIRETPEGALAIEVTDRDPRRAAEIANVIPQIANSIMSRLGADAALHKQAFLERQLSHARDRLNESEESMVRFQETRSAPEVKEQAVRTLDAAATLQEQILKQQVLVAQLQRSATPDNPVLKEAIATLDLWRQQLRQLRMGQLDQSGILLSLQQSPELKADAARLLRRVTADEQLYGSLAMALAQTQIDAQSNLPVLTVLDRAPVPKEPRRIPVSIALGLAAMLGLVFGFVGAFLRSTIRSARLDPENREFFETLQEARSGFLVRPPFAVRSGGEKATRP
jgi:capsule polysaccharide export protein KpsE/RkpR